ncbi:MAG TPA: DNA-primase RepB domain-containing protein [Patescibacteria group bacterium]|nr:DNA-primase RepB domain-containing protein [Patescibacteria group bacterium]
MPDSLSTSEYIFGNFQPSDRIAVLLRNRSTGEVVQRIAPVEKIAARDFQEWLTDRTQAGFDVYIGMNTLKDGAYSRTKRDIHEIRHVYLDLDYRGPEALKEIHKSDEVPNPNFVLDTSPGKRQVVWKVESITPHEAEDLQQRMAHEFGADIAATDASRILRLPGFTNRKYSEDCAVRVTKHSDKTYNLVQ